MRIKREYTDSEWEPLEPKRPKKAKLISEHAALQNTRVRTSFVSLSGEIRNQIYSHALGEPPILDATRTMKIIRKSGSMEFLPHPFFHLTQASRQIRQEFRPLLIDHPKSWLRSVVLGVRDAGAFSKVFLLSDPDSLKDYSAELLVNVRDLFDGTTDQHVNLTTVFKLCIDAPNISCKFVSQPGLAACSTLLLSLNHLLTVKKEAWRRLVQKRSVKIDVSVKPLKRVRTVIYWPIVQLSFSEEYAKPWMHHVKLTPAEVQKDFRFWQKTLGIEQLFVQVETAVIDRE